MKSSDPVLGLFVVLLSCAQPDGQESVSSSGHSGVKPPPSLPATTAFNGPVTFQTTSLRAGTTPGLFERSPSLEPRLFKVKLGPFRMDRATELDANAPRLASLEQASRLCAGRSGRLCTELEWERACKGPDNQPFASGPEWDCDAPKLCATKEGIVGLGAQPEWTASTFGASSPKAGLPVTRGAAPSAAPPAHRCAHRSEAKGNANQAFRCCYGAPNGAVVPEPQPGTTFEFADIDNKRLRELLSSHPETESLAQGVTFFSSPEAARTVVARGPGDKKGFKFTVRPLIWRPVAGAEFLVLSGRSGKRTSFVLTFHTLPDDQYALASSFIMKNEAGPIALAYSPSIKPRLHFSSCWGCLGETGKILYREPDTALVLQP